MFINRVKIIGMLGIDQLEFKAGKWVEFRGHNGSGKSSALNSLMSILNSGHNVKLLRSGESEGEALIELDNFNSLRARVKPNKTDRHMLDSKGKIAGTVSDIKELFNPIAVNPVKFITAEEKDQADIILKAMPLRVDPILLSEISGKEIDAELARDTNALDVIDKVYDELFKERTEINRALEQAKTGKARTIATMPEVSNIDLNKDELLSKKKLLEDEYEKEVSQVNDRLDKVLTGINQKIASKRSEIEDLQERISNLKLSISEDENLILDQKGKVSNIIEQKKSEYKLKVSEIDNSIESIDRNAKNIERIEIAKEQLEESDKEISMFEAQSNDITSTLEKIKEYKIELLKDLPIKGLEVIGGSVVYNGISYAYVNTAKKIEIAVEIAKLLCGELRVVFLDGIESLDSKSYELLKSSLLENNFQCFVGIVDDCEFKVVSE